MAQERRLTVSALIVDSITIVKILLFSFYRFVNSKFDIVFRYLMKEGREYLNAIIL